ncbi:phage tail length tape measure family protein [Ensifer adhaerens]|uniref:phage tail length tape measure family protein n=1 Tax=Ensifer adhaerens TaxID=106592 RepID=UPI000CF0672D|nr:phage tail length tape measure family protein [Ensifer adhaerens]
MASEADQARLIVAIEATQAKFEKQLASIAKAAERSAKKTEDAFRSANDNVAKGFERSSESMRQQGFAAKQLSAQFGDIAAQIAAGTSPLRAVATQADQIRMALQSAGGAANAFRALAAAVFNPITLATTAFTLLGERAIAYFTSVGEGTEAADTALKAHVDLIDAVAREWGDAVPTLKAFAEEAKKAANLADLQNATEQYVDKVLAEAKEVTKGLAVELVDVVAQLRAAGAEEESILRIQQAFKALDATVADGKDSTKEAAELTTALAQAWGETGVTAADSFVGSINRVAAALAEYAKKASAARREAESAAPAMSGGIVPFNPLPADDANRRVQLQAARDSISNIESGGNYRALGPILENGDRAYGKYQVMGRNIAEWTKRAIGTALTPEQFLANPQFQDKVFDHVFGGYIDQFGMQGASEAWFAGPGGVGKSNRKDALGTSVGDYSSKFATGLGEAKDAWAGLRDVTASTRQETTALTQQYADFGQVAQTAVQGLANALADGKLEGKELLQILMQVVQQLISMPSASGGGGGLFGGLLSAIFPFAKGGVAAHGRPQPLKTFARGGVSRTAAIFGEAGPEAAVPLPDGKNIPVKLMEPRIPRAATKSNDTVTIVLQDDSGRMADIADQRIQTASGTIVKVAVSESGKRVVPTMAKYQSEKSGGQWR